MITWVATLWNASGLNKLLPYMIVAALVIAIILSAYLQGKSAGASGAKQQQLNDWLNTQHKEAQARAERMAQSTDAARDQLRKRWSQH